MLHVRIKRVHRRKSVLSAKTVNTDKRYFRVHRVDHLDCCGAYDRMLNLANDSAEDAAAYVAMWLASRPIVTEMQIHGRQHAARLSMAKDQGLLPVNPHIPTIVEVLTNAEIFFPGSQGAAIGELLNVRVAQAVTGEMKPKEALDAAVSDINSYLSSHPGELK